METKKNLHKLYKLLKPLIPVVFILLSINTLFAQNYEWEIEKHRRRELENKKELDSLLVHLKNKWQISLISGRWIFNNSAKSSLANTLEFPNSMNVWNLSFARFISESISVNANIGIQTKKVEPEQPNFFSIINGDNIEIEGGGINFIPISIGIDYYFLKGRFRPYLGIGIGSVSAKAKLVEASGNIYDGIDQVELESSSQVPFIEISPGFAYRAGKNIQLGLNCDYAQSKDFGTNIGGFSKYSGIKITGMFSVVF
jgi:outer membrane protein W